MADLKLENGDMVLENGELSFVTGQAAIGQHIEMRLKTFLGETVYDQAAGVPYLQIIFQRQTPLDSVEFILKSIIEATPGVTGTDLALTLDSRTRILSVTGTAQTIEGDVDFDVSITQTQQAA